jgi:DNA-binding winged helix-turn-helix (wHTH) protein/tetratricopeptide (TPR) repeat protein
MEQWLYEFGPFRLDVAERTLSCDGAPVPLTGKVFDLLLLLVERRGRALTKLELMELLWPDSVVAENNLTVNMSALRKALGESASEPRYIQTLPRRGYRFTGEVRRVAPPAAPVEPLALPRSTTREPQTAASFVGRERELARLEELLGRAVTGRGRAVFVSGGAGMGKSTLVEHFVRGAARSSSRASLLVGRCLEQYGASEAYLPFLEAIRGALFGADAARVREALRAHAPSWCLLFPAAFPAPLALAAERDPTGASGPRLLRELGDALAALSADVPLVLVIEDLHWADPSSVDVVRYLGQRCASLGLLLLGTLRPDQREPDNVPLRNGLRELSAHDQAEELALPLLEASEVGAYLRGRFEPNDFPPALEALLLAHTEGQPLFLTRLSELLIERGDIVHGERGWTLATPVGELSLAVPNSVRALIQRKLDSLAEGERRLLEAASVQGEEFSLLLLARQLELDELALELALEPLERQHRLIQQRGEERQHDGLLATRYRFAHVLYQNVLYEALRPLRRRQLHASAARELLAQHAHDTRPIAAQLGLHFERAGDAERAIEQLMLAADRAGRLLATREAKQHYTQAIGLVDQLPEAARLRYRIILHYNLGWVSFSLRDVAAASLEFTHMLERAQGQLAAPEQTATLASVFDYLEQPWQDSFGALEPPRMPLELRSVGAAAIAAEALCGLCHCLLYADRTDELVERAQQFLRLTEQSGDQPHRTDALGLLAQALIEQNDRARAKPLLDESIAIARALSLPRGLGTATAIRADVHSYEGEYEAARALYEEALALSFQAAGVIYCLCGLGLALANLGRVSEALRALQRAHDVSVRSEERSFGTLVPNTLGWLHRELGDLDGALAHDRAGVELALRDELRAAEVHAWLNLQQDHAARGEPDEAAAALAKAERIAATIAPKRHQCTASRHTLRLWQAQASAAIARGELALAERLARELCAGAERSALAKYVVIARRLLADVHAERGDVPRALVELERAEQALSGKAMPFVSWPLFAKRAELHARARDEHACTAARERAHALVSEIAASVEDQALRARFLARPDVAAFLGQAGLSLPAEAQFAERGPRL